MVSAEMRRYRTNREFQLEEIFQDLPCFSIFLTRVGFTDSGKAFVKNLANSNALFSIYIPKTAKRAKKLQFLEPNQ